MISHPYSRSFQILFFIDHYVINGQEETRHGLAAIYNDLATNRQRVNAISFVTSREDDTKSITKTRKRRRFSFPWFLLLV
jgi:hypothetical protein